MPDTNESRENYLEIILMLSSSGTVRATDIVKKSGFTKPSVSVAMQSLKQSGYIKIDDMRHIELTEKGMQIARQIYERHQYITKYLAETLGISEKIAEENACKIEHIISEDMYAAIKVFVDQLEREN